MHLLDSVISMRRKIYETSKLMTLIELQIKTFTKSAQSLERNIAYKFIIIGLSK